MHLNQKGKPAESDMEKFISVYESCYSVVFSSVYARINNFHDSEDICQEVFIRFYDKIDEVENPRKWLFGCLRIVVLDHYKRKYSRDVDIEEIFDDIGMSYVNGFRDTRMMIQEIMSRMTEEEDAADMSLFDLVAVHNFTFVEAAKHLGMNYKQVRYRFNRITEKITAALKDKGIKSIEDLL